jgi:Uma2 family endonuclease
MNPSDYPVLELPRSLRRHKFTYADVLVMAREGLLDGIRVELRNGELVEMSPQNPPHALNLRELDEVFITVFKGRAKVFCQFPLQLELGMSSLNLPLPDLMLAKRKRYKSHPEPEDIYLIIEVSDSTLEDDLGDKLRDYANAGIPEYWVYDVKAKVFKVHTEPMNGDYNRRVTYHHTQGFAPASFSEDKHIWLPEPFEWKSVKIKKS